MISGPADFLFFKLWTTSVNSVSVRNYWVFGHCLSFGILETGKHNVLETGSVSVLRCLRLALTKRPNRVVGAP
jgi:hypothetical protein